MQHRIPNFTKLLPIILIPIFALLFIFNITPAHAAQCGGVETALIDCDSDSAVDGIFSILGKAVNGFFAALAVIAAIGIAWCGIQYLTAKDNEQQVTKSKHRLRNIIIGLAAYVLMFSAAEFFIPGGIDGLFSPTGIKNAVPTATTDTTTSTPTDKTTTDKTTTRTPTTTVTTATTTAPNIDPKSATTSDYPCRPESRDYGSDKSAINKSLCDVGSGEPVLDFPLGGLAVQWPVKAAGSSNITTSPATWHHGSYFQYNPNFTYKYGEEVRTIGEEAAVTLELCNGNVKPGEWCKDNRIYKDSNGAVGQEPFSTDVMTYLDFTGEIDSFAPSIIFPNISNPDNYPYRITGHDYAWGAGTPVYSALYPSSGGSVTILNVSEYNHDATCRQVNFRVDNGNGTTMTMYYTHLSNVGIKSPGTVVDANTVIGYTGHSRCAQNTGPHVHVTLSYEPPHYSTASLFSGVTHDAAVEGAVPYGNPTAIDKSTVLGRHFTVLCSHSSNSNCYNDIIAKYAELNGATVSPVEEYQPRIDFCANVFPSDFTEDIVKTAVQTIRDGLNCGNRRNKTITLTDIQKNRDSICTALGTKKDEWTTVMQRIAPQSNGSAGAINTSLQCGI